MKIYTSITINIFSIKKKERWVTMLNVSDRITKGIILHSIIFSKFTFLKVWCCKKSIRYLWWKIERCGSVLAMAVDKVRLEGTYDISLKGITLTACSRGLPLKRNSCPHSRNISKTCTISAGPGGGPCGSSSLRLPYLREEKLWRYPERRRRSSMTQSASCLL